MNEVFENVVIILSVLLSDIIVAQIFSDDFNHFIIIYLYLILL